MTLSTVFLVLSVFGLVLSALTLFRVRLHGQLLIPTFVVGWLRGEMALQTIAIEALVTIGFVAGGALEAPRGQLGLALCGVSWAMLLLTHRRGLAAGREMAAALGPLGVTPDTGVSALHGFPNPFRFADPEVERLVDLEYGESLAGDQGGRNRLDIVRPKAARAGDHRPVLLQVHGGAWMIGDKREQGRPLMTKLARAGWICVAINYRLSPKAKMPAHIIDVKRAIAWIRANIERYGGDPEFLCITGGSAGGHLASLAALSANDPSFQPGFEAVDTRLDACVPFYGVFDFLDRTGNRPLGRMDEALGPKVFGSMPHEDPELWDSVCPLVRVHADAPPFLVIQGSHDSLVMSEEADTFVEALRTKSAQAVLHVELRGAQHAFEIFHSPRTEHTVRGVAAFLEKVHRDYEASRLPS